MSKFWQWLLATGMSALHSFSVTLAATGVLGTAVFDKTTFLNDIALSGTAAGATVLAAVISATASPKTDANVVPNPVTSDTTPSAMGAN